MDYVNLLIGILVTFIGVMFFVYITKQRQKGDRGGAGSHIKIYFGAIVFMFVGIVMAIVELLKLF